MWGENDRGQVGNGGQGDIHGTDPYTALPTATQTTPVKIMDNVAVVAFGSNCVGALKTDGTLWMWGGALYGELGDGDGSQHIQWTPKKILDDVVQFSIESDHVGAVKKDGSLYMWGNNASGQLNLPGGDYTHSVPFVGDSSAVQTTPASQLRQRAHRHCEDRRFPVGLRRQHKRPAGKRHIWQGRGFQYIHKDHGQRGGGRLFR